VHQWQRDYDCDNGRPSYTLPLYIANLNGGAYACPVYIEAFYVYDIPLTDTQVKILHASWPIIGFTNFFPYGDSKTINFSWPQLIASGSSWARAEVPARIAVAGRTVALAYAACDAEFCWFIS